MKCKWLNSKKEKQERRVLRARIKWAKAEAELQVIEDTLNTQPTMTGLEYETIE